MSDTDSIWQRIDRLKEVTPSVEATSAAVAKVRQNLQNAESETTVKTANPGRQQPVRWPIALGGALAATVALAIGLTLSTTTSVAFADVQEQLRRFRTVTYSFVVDDGNPTKYFAAGSSLRAESDKTTSILRPDLRRNLHLDHDNRRATFYHDNRKRDSLPVDHTERLRRMADDATELGKRVINGQTAIGFSVPENGHPDRIPMEVWVDPKTRLPVEVIADGNRVLRDFRFDVELMNDMFHQNVPEGYFVENKFTELQAPVQFGREELEQFRAWAADPERSAEQTVKAWLSLHAAGESALAKKKLELHPDNDDDVRELDGFRDLRIDSTFIHPLHPKKLLATTNVAISHGGTRAALVITLSKDSGMWLVADIDLESEEGMQQEIRRFLSE